MQNSYKNTRFGLIRHAETIWNQEKKIQGQNDSPLERFRDATRGFIDGTTQNIGLLKVRMAGVEDNGLPPLEFVTQHST